MVEIIYSRRNAFCVLITIIFLGCFWWYYPVFSFENWIPTTTIIITLGIFGIVALFEYKKSEEERDYLEGFKKIEPIVISKDEIPVDKDALYLGEGFLWENKHAQYVYEKMKDDLSKTIAQMRNEDLGGVNFHAVGKEKKDIFIPKNEFSGHCCIVATTRAGKTTFLRSLATQLIRAKEPVIIIDPKGEHFLLNTCFEETKRTYGTAKPFVFLSASFPLITDTFNPFRTFVNISDVGDRIASVLPQTGDSAPFTSFSFYMVDVITRCLIYLEEEITLLNLKKYSLSPSEWRNLGMRVFQKFFEENHLEVRKRNPDDERPSFSLDDYKFSYFFYKQRGYFNDVIESLIGCLLYTSPSPRDS